MKFGNQPTRQMKFANIVLFVLVWALLVGAALFANDHVLPAIYKNITDTERMFLTPHQNPK